MSQFDKLLNKICLLDRNLRYEELRKVLCYYGYEESSPSGGSSHRTFRKKGCCPITIPVHEPIKVTYVEMVKNVIENEESEKEGQSQKSEDMQ